MVFSALLMAALAGAPAIDCGTASDVQRAACLLDELELADKRINTSYAALRSTLGETGRVELRDSQRGWIKHRDLVCRLQAAPASRAVWLAELAQDYAKTVCVVRFTDERASELEGRLAAPAVARPAIAAPRRVAPEIAPPEIADGSANVYELATRTPHSAGKWYFEFAVKVGDLAQENERTLFIGVRTSSLSTGTLVTIHRQDAAREPVNIGVAVDLDAGKLYIRRNGAWHEGAPGESGGQDLKLGRPYNGWVSSSVALGPALKEHSIEPNFGQQPFVYALPDGYRPIDLEPPMAIPEG